MGDMTAVLMVFGGVMLGVGAASLLIIVRDMIEQRRRR